MKLTCIKCNKEFEAKRKTAKFCSTKCKLAYHRHKVSVSNKDKQVSVSLNPAITGKALKDYTAQDLYDAIDSYPADTWVKSPEFIELNRRLDIRPINKLIEHGYWIPNRIALTA